MDYLPAQVVQLTADIPPSPYFYDEGSSLWSYVCCGACCCIFLIIVIVAVVGFILLISRNKKKK